MTKKLLTDRNFDEALSGAASIMVKVREGGELEASAGYVGSLEAFNPIFVTVSGEYFMRDDCDFYTLR